jgi:hypothetical protein
MAGKNGSETLEMVNLRFGTATWEFAKGGEFHSKKKCLESG